MSKTQLLIALALFFFQVHTSHAMAKPVPQPPLPLSHLISDFQMPSDGVAFQNYGHWDGSHLPEFLQFGHCTSMALISRQVHNWAEFRPDLPEVSPEAYEAILGSIYRIPTDRKLGSRPRIIIPGFRNLYELTTRPELAERLKVVLGDALSDGFRNNFDWALLDAVEMTRKINLLMESRIRRSIANDRVAMIYLTDGTKTAHSILLYGYETHPNSVDYIAYDSNWPKEPYHLTFYFDKARLYHGDWGWRDVWLLHPYSEDKLAEEELENY